MKIRFERLAVVHEAQNYFTFVFIKLFYFKRLFAHLQTCTRGSCPSRPALGMGLMIATLKKIQKIVLLSILVQTPLVGNQRLKNCLLTSEKSLNHMADSIRPTMHFEYDRLKMTDLTLSMTD